MRVYISESRLFSSDFYKKSLVRLKEKREHIRERLQEALTKEKAGRKPDPTKAPKKPMPKVSDAPQDSVKLRKSKTKAEPVKAAPKATRPAAAVTKPAAKPVVAEKPKGVTERLKEKITQFARQLADAKKAGDEKQIDAARKKLIPLRQRFERAYHSAQK